MSVHQQMHMGVPAHVPRGQAQLQRAQPVRLNRRRPRAQHRRDRLGARGAAQAAQTLTLGPHALPQRHVPAEPVLMRPVLAGALLGASCRPASRACHETAHHASSS